MPPVNNPFAVQVNNINNNSNNNIFRSLKEPNMACISEGKTIPVTGLGGP
jgi:hypothetical protein